MVCPQLSIFPYSPYSHHASVANSCGNKPRNADLCNLSRVQKLDQARACHQTKSVPREPREIKEQRMFFLGEYGSLISKRFPGPSHTLILWLAGPAGAGQKFYLMGRSDCVLGDLSQEIRKDMICGW